jgi:hypothetical protein
MRTATHPRAGRRLLAVLALSLAPALASAQSVAGRVLEATTRRPLGGVTVTLVDSAGHAAARTYTLADGIFYLDAPSPGSYALDFAPVDGRSPVRTAARLLASGQEAQVEFVLDPPSPPPPLEEPAPMDAAAPLLGEWFDPQPRGWAELQLRFDRVKGDSIFGEITALERIPITLVMRGKLTGLHLELRAARPGLHDLVLVCELRNGFIIAQRREGKDWEHLLPLMRFSRQRY